MNIIATLELAGLLFAITALVLIVLYGKQHLETETYFFLFLMLCVIVLHHLISIPEWIIYSSALNRWKDAFDILIPVCWAITTNSWLHTRAHMTLNEKDKIIETSKDMLTETERRLSSLMFTVSGVVYRCGNDRDWTMEFISDQCFNLTGYNPDQLINNMELSYADLIHPDDRETVWQDVQEALDKKKSFELNYRIRTSSGDIKRVWEQGIGVWSPSNRLLALEGFIQDVTPMYELSSRVDYYNTHDSITNLLNQRAFEDRLSQAFEQIEQENAVHGLCLVDLDRFSLINESCGMIAGNELLRQVGKLLHRIVRKGDIVARLNGDKFAVFLENCPPEKFLNIIEIIRSEIEEFVFAWHEKKFSLTASCGALIVDNIGETTDELLQRSQDYCRVAKELGRNRVCHSGQDIVEERITRRHGSIVGLELVNNAFTNELFSLYYQPIVPLTDTGDKLHFEVLIRMISENNILVPPASFIPSVEQYGLSVKLDKWVFKTLLDWLEKNNEIVSSLKLCSINLSGQSIGDQRLLEFIIERLEASPVPREYICFEITETAAMENLAESINFMNKLKEYGCSFALDDFGSGMSSFAYLKNLPVDYLKIDGQFVRNIANNVIDYESVMAINRIGKVSGKKTIAEFVESEEIHRLLQQIGVNYGQGYHYDLPKPLEQMGIDFCQGYYYGKPKPLEDLILNGVGPR